jgi:dCMP deaminase
MTVRPEWDEWALGIARAVAARGDCSRNQVGCVVLSPDKTIVAAGYNGTKPGGLSCLQGQCPRGLSDVPSGSSYDTGVGVCIAAHAEQNALLRCTWADLIGATLYVTCKPCDGCAKMIAVTPIVRVVYDACRR